MKRAFLGAALATALLAGTAPNARAYCRFNFGVGLNTSFESSAQYVSFLGYQRYSYPPPWSYANSGYTPPVGYAPPALTRGYGGYGSGAGAGAGVGAGLGT